MEQARAVFFYSKQIKKFYSLLERNVFVAHLRWTIPSRRIM